MSRDAQWVRVEFYGVVPAGQSVRNVDLSEVGETLMRAFGFTHIDGLAAYAAHHADPARSGTWVSLEAASQPPRLVSQDGGLTFGAGTCPECLCTAEVICDDDCGCHDVPGGGSGTWPT